MLLLNLEIALIAACVSLFINYCIGKPGSSEFSPHEIFSSYTVWLATWRLKRLGNYGAYEAQFDYKSAKSEAQLIELENDAAQIIYNAAEPFFTWERAVGMCVICTGFWISLVVGIIAMFFNHLGVRETFLSLVEIIVLSHVIIRILSKWI